MESGRVGRLDELIDQAELPDVGEWTEVELANKPRSNLAVRVGDCLYHDIETVPDESRQHLFPFEPLVITPDSEMKPIAEFGNLKTVEDASAYLKTVTPSPEWVALAVAQEKAREKPRATLLKYLDDAANVVEERIKKLSLNPLCLRIVAIGCQVGQDGDCPVWLAESDDEEREALRKCFALIDQFRPVVGFNNQSFDMPALLMRAAILGVEVPRLLNLSRYSSSDVLDLMNVIYAGFPPKGFGMKATAKMLGIELEDDGDGSQVYKWYKAGDWTSISKYQRSDVKGLAAIHAKISGKLCL